MNELQILPPKPKGFKRMSVIFGNGKNTNSRNSRDIHKYMNVKTKYHMWIKRRVDSLGAEENIDFIVLKNGHDKFTEIDYIITDDFAKHLGMVEKNIKGKEVRDYFIYMEKLAQYLIIKTCNQKEVQLKISQAETKKAMSNKMKTYRNDRVALRKYLSDNDIDLSEESAWLKLLDEEIISVRNHTTLRKFLNNSYYGVQEGAGTIEFNSRALDDVFSDYVKRDATLF